jgi:hypothetical protein
VLPRNITERVAAFIAVSSRIGHGANAHTVQHNPDHALKDRQAD